MSIELNDIPSLIEEGKLSKKEAINHIIEFIYRNPAVFSLEKENEDFRDELLLDLLEKGERLFEVYNPQIGKFFPYLYATVIGRVKSLRKKECHLSMKESCIFEEAVQEFTSEDSKVQEDTFLKPVTKAYARPPFAQRRVSAEELEEVFKKTKLSKKIKSMLIILFKYAFFIDYEQLKNVCKETGFDYEFLALIKDYSMQFLEKKTLAHSKAYQDRNRTYFLKKRTALEIRTLKKELLNSDGVDTLSYKLDSLTKKYHKQSARLVKDNSEIAKKAARIVLPDSQIANCLGLCERQVRYYISKAKNKNSKLSITQNSENTD